jgi:RNA polymerase sigma factor (TIGR02999 family)
MFLFRDGHLVLDAIPNTGHLLATGLVGGYTSAKSSRPFKPEPVMSEVTQILSAIERGDPHAAEQLLPLVYDELRQLAAQKLAHEQPGQTLQATALVHEAYLRLVGGEQPQDWDGRGHFFAAAAEAMRRILIDSARSKSARKRGGAWKRIDLNSVNLVGSTATEDLVELDDTLDKLGQQDPQAAQLVKLRYYAGLSIEQAGASLGLSRTIAFERWAFARAWLYTELKGPAPEAAD